MCGPTCACAACQRRTHKREYMRAYREKKAAPRPTPIQKRPVRHKREWTQEELCLLDTLAGRPLKEIALRLRRTERGVRDKLAENKNLKGDMLTLAEASREYCSHLTDDGARLRIEQMIASGKVRAYRTAVGHKTGHWRIDYDDLESHRAELAAPRKTWKCDDAKARP